MNRDIKSSSPKLSDIGKISKAEEAVEGSIREGKRAYTNREIFEEMLREKPELLKLKEALGLDSDF